MRHNRPLTLIVAVLVVVVTSFAVMPLASASYQSPPSEAAASHRMPVSESARRVERDWLPYVVASDESLVDIAGRFGVSVAALAATNGISDFENLSAGQVVWIPMLATEAVRVVPSHVKAITTTILYAGPSATFGIAAKMRAGETGLVLGRSMDGDWLRIASVSSASSGWIKADSALFRMFVLPDPAR